MSEDSLPLKGSGDVLPRAAVLELLLRKFERLPEREKKLFSFGPAYLGGNAAFAGLIANSLFRRLLNITQGRLTSSLPMAVLPFLTTVALYNATVSQPLLSGDLNCPTCTIVRGGLVGAVAGGMYPILLALPVNAALATRYSTAPMPEKGNVMRFWFSVTQPIMRKMTFVMILQALFGVFLSSRHYDIYLKMLQLPATDGEDLHN